MAYIGEEIPKLGFGLMRLPEFEEEDKKVVDIEQVKQMVDEFLEAGFTYFDTAYLYHGGRSEKAIKEALVDRYPRESFQLATKNAAWSADSAEKAKAMFETSLERTGAGYFDYYLVHNIGGPRTQAFEEYGIWEYLVEKKQQGLIKYLGFSIHDKADALEETLQAHPEVDFVQLQINYADWENPVVESRKCYEIARAYNKPIIIMEPLKGGALTKLPDSVAHILNQANPEVSQAYWGIRYAASLEGIITVLSGMSNIEQMRDNIQIMKDLKPLSTQERQTIKAAQDELAKIPTVPCTDCRYCMDDCPQEIEIPAALNALNTYLMYGDLHRAKEAYLWNVHHHASTCIACGVCEGTCPQSIEIISELERAADVLEKKEGN